MAFLVPAYLLLVLVASLLVCLRRRKSQPPFPPGPPADPLVGHIRVYPKRRAPETFIELGKQYGDVLYFNVLGQQIIVLNSYEDAINLLEKRSANYSDRPDFVVLNLMGYGNLSSIVRYSDQWRSHRKLLQERLLSKSCETYQDIQLQNVGVLLQMLPGIEGDCNAAIARFSAGIALEIAYGHRVEGSGADDEYIRNAKVALDGLGLSTTATNLVDILPFLRHTPSWFPVLSTAVKPPRAFRPYVDRMYNKTFSDALKKLKDGTAIPCFVTDQVEKHDLEGTLDDLMLDIIRDTAATIYVGGMDTTWASLSTFINAMVVYPNVQRKAQGEVDRVIGHDRLPDFSDRGKLPYLECLLQEIIRWNPVSPEAPHRSMNDDMYKGMFIPGNAMILPNMIAMNRDERVYCNPNTFYPDRFLPQPDGYGEKHLVSTFGFGRRICPGRHLASANLWIAMARILAVFDVTNVVRNGKVVGVKSEFTNSIISHPEPFECAIKPRSAQAERLLHESAREG